MKQVASYVTKKTGSDQNLVHNAQPLGGTYVRLESEWKEMLKQRHSTHNLLNSNASNLGGTLGSSNSNLNLYSSLGATVGAMACGPGAAPMSKQKHK